MPTLVTREHDSLAAHWEVVQGRPAPALMQVLSEPYYGYVEQTAHPLRRREYPALRVVLIIELGAPILLIDPHDEARTARHAHGFVAGVRHFCALTEHGGCASGIQVNLTPNGARRLFGLPLSELTDRIVPLQELLGPLERELLERLVAAVDWAARFELLDRLLLGLLFRSRPSDLGVHHALCTIARSARPLDIAQLARELDCSHKRLIERFRDQVGLTPKVAARLARFERTIALLRTGAPGGFAELASRAGYFDHSHLVREFQFFTGGTPGEARAAIATTGMPAQLRGSTTPLGA